jgi:hypothetical protein
VPEPDGAGFDRTCLGPGFVARWVFFEGLRTTSASSPPDRPARLILRDPTDVLSCPTQMERDALERPLEDETQVHMV